MMSPLSGVRLEVRPTPHSKCLPPAFRERGAVTELHLQIVVALFVLFGLQGSRMDAHLEQHVHLRWPSKNDLCEE